MIKLLNCMADFHEIENIGVFKVHSELIVFSETSDHKLSKLRNALIFRVFLNDDFLLCRI